MVVVTTSETQRCYNDVTTLSDVATNIQPKPNVVTTSCASRVVSFSYNVNKDLHDTVVYQCS